MWYKVTGGETKPPELDTTSSKRWNYVRKNFEYINAIELNGQDRPAHWEWDEQKVLKDDWDMYLQVQMIGLDDGPNNLMTSDRRYEPGEYLTRNNVMYKVILPIMVGAYITPGTNVEATTIGQEIMNINKEDNT